MAINLDLSFLKDAKSSIYEVPVEELSVDPRIQRPLDLNRVREVFREFTPAGLGVLIVSYRGDGSYVVLDGQHRLEVLRRKLPEGGPVEVPCKVFEGLTYEQEALLFLVANNTRKPRAVHKFLIGGEAGDPVVKGIQEIAKSHGYKIDTAVRNGMISAVRALYRIYANSERKREDGEPNTLELVIKTVKSAWGYDKSGTKGIVLDALAAMYEEYGSRLVLGNLVEVLNAYPNGPDGLVMDGHRWAATRKMRPAMATAQILVDRYNGTFRAKRAQLPEWRKRK